MSTDNEYVWATLPPISAKRADQLARQAMRRLELLVNANAHLPSSVTDVDSPQAASTLAVWANVAVSSVENEERKGVSGKRHRHPDNEDTRCYEADAGRLIARSGSRVWFQAESVSGEHGSYDLTNAPKGALVWVVAVEFLAREDSMDDEPFYFLFGAVCLGNQWKLVRYWLDTDREAYVFRRDDEWYATRRKRTPGTRTTAARLSRRRR